MTHKLPALAWLTLSLLALPAYAAEGNAFERIEAACKETLRPDFEAAKLGKICGCVRRNYEAKPPKEDALELLVRSHEQDNAAEQELQKTEWEDALLFDYDVTDGCVKKPSYRYP
jgi:hypothetical protein